MVIAGPDTGRKFVVADGAVLGRAAGLAVQLRDAVASREHARIARGPDGFVLEDLGSRNGTMVNGRRAVRAVIHYGDQIQIGGTTLLFAHRDPLEDRLLEREQLEILGRLGAGLVHDMNNLLSITHACASELEAILRDPAPTARDRAIALECVESITTANARSRELNAHLLRLAKRQRLQSEELDLSALVGEAIDLARRTFGRRVDVARLIAPGLRVVGTRSDLHRAVMNLLLNARDAMPDGGTLSVALGAEADPADPDGPGRFVHLIVQDTGVGMDEETRAHLFEPLYTSKATGTGLGLSTVARIVSEHGGRIRCTSAPRRGTTFEVVLPRSSALHGALGPTTKPPAPAASGT